MKYLYLDHNIYIAAFENQMLQESLVQLKDKGIQCLYSPAHIEEIYKVVANEESRYKNKMEELMHIISVITSNMEVLPSNTELILEKEHPKVCYNRVRSMDTRERVESDSHIRYLIDTNNYKDLLKKDKHNSSLSNVEPEKIWETPIVSEYISELNKDIDFIIEKYNSSWDVQILSLLNIDRRLPHGFCFKQGNFSELKKSHTQLEYTIETLFRVLNYSGYYAEKSERTSISGTHDVTHAIYATKSDALLSTDLRFAKKCQAVYKFLGVGTFVMACKQNEIVDIINNMDEANICGNHY